MKYYEIIYTSSECSVDSGNPGFGIRAITEGMPPEYVEILQNREMFSYESGSFTRLYSDELMENPEKIREYPVTFVYDRAKTCSGKTIYFIARKIYIGFDYPYYSGSDSARVGNFCVHVFICEEKPPLEWFELLYTNPATGSVFFKPYNNVCSRENTEIRALVLGKPEPVSSKNQTFLANPQKIDARALELCFAYMDALHQGKKLVVKTNSGEEAPLMGDVLKLLPPQQAVQSFFTLNYQNYGVSQDLEFHFINQYFDKEIYKDKAYVIDYTGQPKQVNSREKEVFGQMATEALAAGDRNTLHNLFRFTATPDWKKMAEEPAGNILRIYNYMFYPEKFNLLPADKPFIELLAGYFRENPGSDQLAWQLILQLIAGKKQEDILTGVSVSSELEKQQVRMPEEVKKQIQKKLAEWFTENEKNTLLYLNDNATTLSFRTDLLDPDLLRANKDLLLKNKNLSGWWFDLVPLCYKSYTSGDIREIIISALTLIPEQFDKYEKYFTSILPDDNKRLDIYLELLETHQELLSYFWKLIKPLIPDNRLNQLKYWENPGPEAAEMFLYIFEKEPGAELPDLLNEINECIANNTHFKKSISKADGKKLLNSLLAKYESDILRKQPEIDLYLQQLTEIATLIDKEKIRYISDLMLYYHDRMPDKKDRRQIEALLDFASKNDLGDYAKRLLPLYFPLIENSLHIEKFIRLNKQYIYKSDEELLKDAWNLRDKQLTREFAKAYLKSTSHGIKDSLRLLNEYPQKEKEEILAEVYGKQYSLWKLKHIFSALFGSLFSKKEESAKKTEPEEKDSTNDE